MTRANTSRQQDVESAAQTPRNRSPQLEGVLQPLQTSRLPVPHPALRAGAVVAEAAGEAEGQVGAGAGSQRPKRILTWRNDP